MTPGFAFLLDVAFRENRLFSVSGLRVSASPCSDLLIIDAENNELSSDGCGVLVWKKSNLESRNATGKRIAETDERMSSWLYAWASSTTTTQGFPAAGDDLTVVRVCDGVLSPSVAAFNQNSLDKKIAEESKTFSTHSVNSFAVIGTCGLTANEGFSGSAVFAMKPSVSTWGSAASQLRRSFERWLRLHDKLELEAGNTTSINNSARPFGGFMYTENSDVPL